MSHSVLTHPLKMQPIHSAMKSIRKHKAKYFTQLALNRFRVFI
jgi:hypothetical protein